MKCITKGEEAKKYEFGNKSSIVKTRKSGIIVGAMAFTDNLYDGDTLLPQLVQTQRIKAGALEIFARLIWVVFGLGWNRKFAS